MVWHLCTLLGMTTTQAEGTALRRIPADTFALRLKATRLDAGDLTIFEAAERCGISNQSWSNWEHGRVPRDLADIVLAISETFSVDRDWLMYGGPLAVASPRRRRKLPTCAYGSARVVERDRPQTSGARPSTYGAISRPVMARPGAIQRRRGAAV